MSLVKMPEERIAHLDLASSEEFGILAGLTTHRSLAVSRSFRISGY